MDEKDFYRLLFKEFMERNLPLLSRDSPLH